MGQKSPLGQYPKGGPDWATIARWEDDGRPDLNADGTPAIPCQWTEDCTRGAIGNVARDGRPTPTCKLCAERGNLALNPFPSQASRLP